MNCKGPEGPPGPAGPIGPVGPPGDPVLSLLYEVEYDLNPSTEWNYLFEFPAADLQYIYPEDVVLVYLLVDEVQNDAGEWRDIWKLMPVLYFEEEGILNLTYDFTHLDVSIYMEASSGYPIENDPGFSGLISRIVVVPADWGAPNGKIKKPIDYENYEEVMNALGLPITKSTGTPFNKHKINKLK